MILYYFIITVYAMTLYNPCIQKIQCILYIRYRLKKYLNLHSIDDQRHFITRY